MIYDKSGLKIGRAIDVTSDGDGSATLVGRGRFFEEKLETLGIEKNIDLIGPRRVIETIGDTIKLAVGKDNLALAMDETLRSKEGLKAQSDIDVHRNDSKVRRFSQRAF